MTNKSIRDYINLIENAQSEEVAEGWTKLPSGDYQNSHTGVRTSKPPAKKKRGEKTGAEWDAIKAKKQQGMAEGERGLGRPTTGTWDPTSGKVGRVEKTATGIRHHADPSRYGGTEPGTDDDHLLSKAQIYRLAKATEPEVDEGKPKKPEQPEADYGDDYQDMVARVKKLAGMGPLKTVYDPQKRVYKNVPTAVQPKK